MHTDLFNTKDFLYKLTNSHISAQYILDAAARINIAEGAKRSSKTYSWTIAFVLHILEQLKNEEAKPAAERKQNLLFLAAGRTMDSVESTIVSTARELFGRSRITYKRGKMMVYGATVDVVGANDERMARTIQGRTYHGVMIDELTIVPRNFFDMANSQMMGERARMFATCNPDGPNHWVMRDLIQRADGKNIYTCKWRLSRDFNPSLSEEYIKSMHSSWPVTSVFYRRNILGEWCAAEGLVYDMFDGAKHIVECVPRERVIHSMCAIDYGTNNPFTAGIYEITDDGRIFLSHEYWYDSSVTGKQKTDEQYARDLEAWFIAVNYTGDYIVCDPSALSFITTLRQRGHVVYGGNNSIIDGVRTVQTLIEKGRFFVHHSCAETIREFAMYAWDSRKQAQGVDMPLKLHDHTMDRNRYALTKLVGTIGLTDEELEEVRSHMPF